MKYIFPNSYFYGSLKEGKTDGFGQYIFFDGCRYRGDLKENKFHGYGEYIKPNHFIYEGFFDHSHYSGLGCYTCRSYTYYGNFKNGTCNGYGIKVLNNGHAIEAIWINNQPVHNYKVLYSQAINEKINEFNSELFLQNLQVSSSEVLETSPENNAEFKKVMQEFETLKNKEKNNLKSVQTNNQTYSNTTGLISNKVNNSTTQSPKSLSLMQALDILEAGIAKYNNKHYDEAAEKFNIIAHATATVWIKDRADEYLDKIKKIQTTAKHSQNNSHNQATQTKMLDSIIEHDDLYKKAKYKFDIREYEEAKKLFYELKTRSSKLMFIDYGNYYYDQIDKEIKAEHLHKDLITSDIYNNLDNSKVICQEILNLTINSNITKEIKDILLKVNILSTFENENYKECLKFLQTNDTSHFPQEDRKLFKEINEKAHLNIAIKEASELQDKFKFKDAIEKLKSILYSLTLDSTRKECKDNINRTTAYHLCYKAYNYNNNDGNYSKAIECLEKAKSIYPDKKIIEFYNNAIEICKTNELNSIDTTEEDDEEYLSYTDREYNEAVKVYNAAVDDYNHGYYGSAKAKFKEAYSMCDDSELRRDCQELIDKC